MTQPLFAVRGLKAFYGNIQALKGIDLDVNEGEIVTLIGANGAGKSTLMMTTFGSPRAREGSITFEGRDITQMPPHEIAKLRIAQSPEGRRIFPRMSVLENLQMGATVANPEHFEADLKRVCAMFPILEKRINQRGGTLSGGEQQMLAIARALIAKPRILMADEPTGNLDTATTEEILKLFAQIHQDGQTVLMVTHENDVAAHCERVVRLRDGLVLSDLRAEDDAAVGPLVAGVRSAA